MVILFVGVAALGRNVEHTPDNYLETATVEFAPDTAANVPNSYAVASGSLITTSAAMAESLMSPQSRNLVRNDGGTASFDLTLANFNNQDFPEYSYPFATLSAEATDPKAVHRTFLAALQVLNKILAERQITVPVLSRVSVAVVDDTGPVVQPGSLKRSLAAICVLGLLAAFIFYNFTTRYLGQSVAYRSLGRRNPRSASRSAQHRVRRSQ